MKDELKKDAVKRIRRVLEEEAEKFWKRNPIRISGLPDDEQTRTIANDNPKE